MTEKVAPTGEAVPTAQELVDTFVADTMASMSDWERAQLPMFAGDEVRHLRLHRRLYEWGRLKDDAAASLVNYMQPCVVSA
jgi:hypothetical protein